MGWRDINLNRRKPQRNLAVLPVAEGGNRDVAVQRKAAAAASAAVARQLPAGDSPEGGAQRFVSGYAAGFACHQAMRFGAEPDVTAIFAALATEPVPAAPRPSAVGAALAPLALADPVADAGFLVGHLESLCGTARLLRLALEFRGREGAAELFLTACDLAADRLQTHQPTARLRFDAEERRVVAGALAGSGGRN